MSKRSILHIDMNNFYASVECMLDPSLKAYPIAVCGRHGRQEDRHGIVLAKNYAAIAHGVSTGEATWQVKQKCKDLVIVAAALRAVYEILKACKRAKTVGVRSNRMR